MTTRVHPSAATTTYGEGYNVEDSEWSPLLEKPISNLVVNFEPHIVNAQRELALQLEQKEEEKDKDIYDFFDNFDPDYTIDTRREEISDEWKQLVKDVLNFVNPDDQLEYQFYDDILSNDLYDLYGTRHILSRFPIASRETNTERSHLDCALGRSWIMDDSIRILRQVCLEIQNHDIFVEFLIKHTSEVRRVNKEIIRGNIGGGGDNSYLLSNEYEIMLYAAVGQRLDTLIIRGHEGEFEDEWMKNNSGELFFSILEEINNMLLDPNTELDILLELIYEGIEIN